MQDREEGNTSESVDRAFKQGRLDLRRSNVISSLLEGFLLSDFVKTPVGFLEFLDNSRADPLAASDEEADFIRSIDAEQVRSLVRDAANGIRAGFVSGHNEEIKFRMYELNLLELEIFEPAARMEMRRGQFRKHYK